MQIFIHSIKKCYHFFYSIKFFFSCFCIVIATIYLFEELKSGKIAWVPSCFHICQLFMGKVIHLGKQLEGFFLLYCSFCDIRFSQYHPYPSYNHYHRYDFDKQYRKCTFIPKNIFVCLLVCLCVIFFGIAPSHVQRIIEVKHLVCLYLIDLFF